MKLMELVTSCRPVVSWLRRDDEDSVLFRGSLCCVTLSHRRWLQTLSSFCFANLAQSLAGSCAPVVTASQLCHTVSRVPVTFYGSQCVSVNFVGLSNLLRWWRFRQPGCVCF